MVRTLSFKERSGIAAERSVLPARSPYPLIQPWTWVTPAETAASEFATATPASLWQWIPSDVEVIDSRTCATVCVISPGSDPPFVSQSTRHSAPACSAAPKTRSANSGFSRKPSKKCSPSRNTLLSFFVKNSTESETIATASSSDVLSASSTWRSQVLATMHTTSVSASTRARNTSSLSVA
ncbi:unannotated protein [freshwater metagenome]|uniref:Unannotated protein n=1 Tax=freshwater metagenome TaxID=449393 RepID=A0A6J7ADE3_9ZZZZ